MGRITVNGKPGNSVVTAKTSRDFSVRDNRTMEFEFFAWWHRKALDERKAVSKRFQKRNS